SGSAMNRTIDTATAEKRLVRGIDDRSDRQRGDVGLERAERWGGIGGRKRLPKGERLGRWTLAAKDLELGNGLGDGWPMALWHPPQDEKSFAHLLEPFPAAAQDFHVSRPIDVLA